MTQYASCIVAASSLSQQICCRRNGISLSVTSFVYESSSCSLQTLGSVPAESATKAMLAALMPDWCTLGMLSRRCAVTRPAAPPGEAVPSQGSRHQRAKLPSVAPLTSRQPGADAADDPLRGISLSGALPWGSFSDARLSTGHVCHSRLLTWYHLCTSPCIWLNSNMCVLKYSDPSAAKQHAK